MAPRPDDGGLGTLLFDLLTEKVAELARDWFVEHPGRV